MADYDTRLAQAGGRRAPAPSPSGFWREIVQAFRRAGVSLCHPKMVFAIFLPFFIGLLGLVVMCWLAWTPVTHWLLTTLAETPWLGHVNHWLFTASLFSFKFFLAPVLAGAIFLPLAGMLGLIISAIWVMPMVLRHVERRDYPGLVRRGRYPTLVSAWNAIWVGLLFIVGWLLTLPLWLFPPLGMLLSVFWWAFAFSRMLRVDAIVEHASADERRAMLKQRNTGFWVIGLVCGVVNLLPPAWIVLPVFGTLVFAHYGMNALVQRRSAENFTM